MAAVAGYGGSISGTDASVREWSINAQVAVLDVTDFGSAGNEEVIRGLKGCDGSLTAQDLGSETPIEIGTEIDTLDLASGNLTISGVALVTGIQPRVAVDSKVEHTVNFKYTGEVTIT